MKKKNLTLIMLTLSSIIYAQVGINTPNPAATLDITAKNATGSSTAVDGLLVARVDRLRAQNMVGTPTSTMIYVNGVTNGTQAGTAINIDAIGYYYYNGTAWVKLHNPANAIDTNIYNTSGTLTGNRTVTQGGNTLAFTASSVNAFSVNGNNFSVDALNRRIGIGTAAPTSFLSILNPVAGTITDILTAGIDNCGAPCGQGTPRNVTLYNNNVTNPLFGGIEFIPSTNPAGVTGASIIGIDRDITNNYAGLQFFTRNATDYAARMTVKSSGNVGIGTVTPTNQLHVNGTDPLRLQGTTAGNTSTDPIMVMDASGIVKTIGTLGALSIPNPSVFRLETAQNNFLNGITAGGSSVVPMAVVKNSINNMTYNAATSTITFPPGTYQMTVVYEAIHNNTGCTISSYFVDFPLNATTTRIHNTAAHSEGALSNHGGTITYATTIATTRTWPIQLGRGQSGNCSGTGMTLAASSTQLLVFRIGD